MPEILFINATTCWFFIISKNKVFRKGLRINLPKDLPSCQPASGVVPGMGSTHPIYHKLYFERNEQEAILLHPSPADPAPAATRIAGCWMLPAGGERHARILADQDYDVTGIDLAPSSIEYAGSSATITWISTFHDMRQIFCTNCFDYAFNFFTSFGYFPTPRDNDRVIKMVSLALKNRGSSCWIISNERLYAATPHPPVGKRDRHGVVYNITRWADTTHFYKRIRIADQHLKEPLNIPKE